jgi:hypothetical protein
MGAALANDFAMVLLVERSIDKDACDDTEKHTNTYGDEGQSGLGDSEVVRRTLENVWNGGEEEEQYAERK